jgi:MFS transporter, PAT family, beta-lactamase induction signal transducer AmpG
MQTVASRDLSTGIFAVLFGFMTGIVLPIATGLLNFRLAQAGADTKTIGLVYVISIPYALSFITTPLLEKLKIPYFFKIFGKSGPLLVILQAIMCLAVYLMGVFDLAYSLKTIVFLTFLMTVAGAAQENLFGAIRTRMAKGPMQGFVSGMHVTGCRMGMIFAGPVAIAASEFFSWTQIHTVISLTIAAFPAIVLTYLFNNKEQAEITVQQRAEIPWKELLVPMLFIVLYNAPDNMLVPMLNKFLLGRGFIGAEIAMAGKLFGYIGAAIGSILGSLIMRKISITSGLFWFGLIHAIAHSGYAFLADADKVISNLMAVTAIESVTGGMKIAACIGLTTALCSKSKSAGHYSFFSSALGISRALLPSITGIIASHLPWQFFFPLMSIIAIPSLLMVKRLNGILQNAVR